MLALQKRENGSYIMETRTAIIFFTVSSFCFLIAIIIALLDFHFRRRSLKRMRDMIQSAMDGTFSAETYDESLYASVESKLAEYLSASETRKGKVSAEQDKIKTLIADISHQTKTPIANLLLYTELLKEEEGGEDNATVALLESQVKKLDFLIQSLVKLSRLETGVLVLHPEKNELSALLEEAQKQYAAKAAEKGLYLHVFAKEAPGMTARFDPKWTLEALGNLMDNAIKYTKTGGVTVSVRPYELFVSIEVADTGIGIAEREQAKIFGRFYRSMAVSDSEGVGIGLYLAREIVKQESGYIQVTSEVGKGTTFSLYLPVD